MKLEGELRQLLLVEDRQRVYLDEFCLLVILVRMEWEGIMVQRAGIEDKRA